MKINISFKTNDVLDYPLDENDFHGDERDDLKEKLEKWIKYGECVTLQYDTENDTMVVLKK